MVRTERVLSYFKVLSFSLLRLPTRSHISGTATQPARKALAKKPAPSIISTAAPGPGRKRKVPDIVEDLDGPKHPSKTRRTRGPAPVSRAAQKPQSRTAQRALAPLRVLNTAPAQVLTVFAFGTGDCGELGLGPKERGGPRPLVNRFLDPTDGFRAVQLACGGMHVVALTSNNEIVTWGVNDKGALGRDTDWEEPLRDMDAESSDEDDDHLNPLESTPTAVPSDSFPPGTVFVQVAAGDSCTLALTNTGLVYAWGSFAVSCTRLTYPSQLTNGSLSRIAKASSDSATIAPGS